MIISCSTLGKNGRLGNQLFQIASTLGLAEKYGAQAAFPDWEYEPYFENVLPHGPMSDNTIQEKYFHHYDWEITSDTDVMGFLQSEKYFPKGFQPLRFREKFLSRVRETYSELFLRETICIQVRRGDYVGNPNYHQTTITYYLTALIEHFPNWKDCNILVISDDVEYCKVHFGCLPNVFFTDGSSDIEDMALASLCDHFIISNSSFGWWCAWLGEKPSTKVIHSGHMFKGKLARKDTKDYRPERWTAHHRPEYKLPLKDLTFTIPVFYDHQNRKENLDLVCFLLLKDLDTNIIICEQGGNRFDYVNGWAQYLQHNGNTFHRTRMLNEMCNATTTLYIANWDCDVIIPPMQIYVAVEHLRAGVDMAYPYHGGFARMPRMEWYRKLQESFDIGVVRDTYFKRRDAAENSVGGAVFWNKDSFIDAGMENEYMVSFGPEDVERYNRAKKLGYKIKRVNGPLFHLNHHVGVTSSPKNPYFQHNVSEEEKVNKMSREELQAYVDSWPWRNQYTTRYYTEISEGAIRSAKIVMRELGQVGISFKRVIDIGCGVGEWSNGNPDYYGIDHRIDTSKLLFPKENYTDCNLNREFPDLSLEEFDLALCLEVAEHLHPSRAEPLVEYLCSLADHVLFSAAIPYQGGQGHINEQWQSYWGKLFQKNGFGPMSWLCPNDPRIELWYRQNIVLYKKGCEGIVEDFVLPEYYEQIVKGLKHG
jgi:hypothetical protein